MNEGWSRDVQKGIAKKYHYFRQNKSLCERDPRSAGVQKGEHWLLSINGKFQKRVLPRKKCKRCLKLKN